MFTLSLTIPYHSFFVWWAPVIQKNGLVGKVLYKGWKTTPNYFGGMMSDVVKGGSCHQPTSFVFHVTGRFCWTLLIWWLVQAFFAMLKLGANDPSGPAHLLSTKKHIFDFPTSYSWKPGSNVFFGVFYQFNWREPSNLYHEIHPHTVLAPCLFLPIISTKPLPNLLVIFILPLL